MIDERRETLASLYAVGALSPNEAREFESALRGDAQVRALVAELRGAADAMAAGFPQVTAPPEHKARIMSSIAARPGVLSAQARAAGAATERPAGWMVWLPYALAACFAVLCVVLISLGRSLREQAVALRDQLDKQAAEAVDLRSRLEELEVLADEKGSNYTRRIESIRDDAARRVNELQRQANNFTNQLARDQNELKRRLGASEADADRLKREKEALEEAIKGISLANNDRLNNARLAVLRPTDTGPAQALGASIWLVQEQRGLVVFERLPTLPASQSYQLWLIDQNTPGPVNAGAFASEGTNLVRHLFSTTVNVRSLERFAVSVEPKGGMPRPTGKFILSSE